MEPFFENIGFSPIQKINDDRLAERNIQLFVKRDDLLHPSVSGNKFRKLKYNLVEMQRLGLRRLVTFGGAFSNHIHAVAAAGNLCGIETVGIIRGENMSNPTLDFARQNGMDLRFVSRTDYRDKELIINNLKSELDDFYVLPEGGSNVFAVRGAAEICLEINEQLDFFPNYVCVACGTGGTLAGLCIGATWRTMVLGFAVLKGDFLGDAMADLLVNFWANPISNDFPQGILPNNLGAASQIQNDYHFGGYARWNTDLIDFVNDFKQKHGIALDPIYTGKLFYGVFDLVKKGFFPQNSSIVLVNTGGLQGIAGFNECAKKHLIL